MAELESLDIKFVATPDDIPAELGANTLIFLREGEVAGTIALATGDWSSNTAIKTITGLTNNDMLKIAPVSKTDAANWAAANIWVTHSGSAVTFAADTAPSASIAVVYEITRGIL